MRPWIYILVFAAIGGCARGPQFASVEGVVRLDGKPLPDVEVQFIPDVTSGAQGPPASAYTDKEGRYQIVATSKSGVVVGKNRVGLHDATVMMPSGRANAEAEGGVVGPAGAGQPRRVRVPTAYSDAARSPLGVVEIQAGSQTREFELKSRP